MPRRKNSRAISREQNDNRITTQDGNESLSSENGMETGRAERMRGAGARGDANAGDEGLDDPAMSATHRDDMTATPMQGDKLEPDMMESGSDQSMQSQRSLRTNQRANDERYDDASDFSGRGGQKEGSRRESESRREGTGYTKDR